MDMKNLLKNYVRKNYRRLKKIFSESNRDGKQYEFGNNIKIYEPNSIDVSSVHIGEYTYIAGNSVVSHCSIGKFCSIGPNLLCGYGIHPLNGISTHPMFYSTLRQNGATLSATDKIIERKQITIGNDVFIGANVTILDGINIGNGAVIAAGAVVTKDVPDYAVFGGVPAKLIKYRFSDNQIKKLLEIKWWDFPLEKLKLVEKYFFDVDKFIDDFSL